MTLLIVATLLVLAALTTGAPRAATDRRGHCPRIRAQIVTERVQTWRLQRVLDLRRSRVSSQPVNGCHYAGWVRDLWRHRHHRLAKTASYRVLPATKDWQTAVKVAQRPFPGTESWLWSCSDVEGGHGEWVTYGRGHYYPGFERLYIVGGPMQYKWPTFKGHYRHALESLRSRGFIVHLPAPDDVHAWLSMSAQAFAAGWARWSGNDAQHWSASWHTGCA